METDVGQLTTRKEPNPYCPTRPNVLHCYGVHFLSNKEVLSIFEEFKPQTVEWIDDSSCNVVFESPEMPPEALRGLSELGDEACNEESPWTKTKVLTIRPAQQAKAKARARAQPRNLQLELRIATEEDRKDLGHSGHTDSVYYAQVKEQQALEKQTAELRQQRKRQRQSRLPPARTVPPPSDVVAGDEAGAVVAATSVAASSSTSPAPAVASTGGLVLPGDGPASAGGGPGPILPADGGSGDVAAAVRLGCRGLLDPLLFMRAPTVPASSPTAPLEDLGAALRQAEAEYAAVPLPNGLMPLAAPGAMAGVSQLGVGQQRRRSSKPPVGRQQSGQTVRDHQAERGKKRRPVDQEPRPVQSTAAPRKRIQALPQVEEFLKAQRVRCQKFTILRTYRNIKYRQQQLKKASMQKASKAAAEAEGADTIMNQADADPKRAAVVSKKLPLDGLPAWEQYFKLNHHFVRHGSFMHTVAFTAGGRKVLAVVPHPMWVDQLVMAKALQLPKTTIHLRKLKDLEADGFPVFVCPPCGHPKDSQGREPVLLVDSSVKEMKRPLLFDCGSVGLSIPAGELLRSTSAVCVDGLGYEPTQVPSPSASVGEPAPEPAPLSMGEGETRTVVTAPVNVVEEMSVEKPTGMIIDAAPIKDGILDGQPVVGIADDATGR